MMGSAMAKELENLGWVEELLPADHLRKRMFGGFAYYMDEKLVLVIFESEGNKVYRGEKYDFEIWNGCMLPVEKDQQPAVLKNYPYLISHPVLPKWLYLPAETENFESLMEPLLKELRRKNPLFGSIPKAKGVKSSKKKNTADEIDTNIDTRRPRMFSDEPAEEKIQKVKKISDFKNLGPEAEKTFAKAGIKTPQVMIKLGWKKTMEKLCKSNPKNNHSIMAYAVIGALKNQMWNLISESEKLEAREFMKALRDRQAKKTSKGKSKKKSKKTVKKK